MATAAALEIVLAEAITHNDAHHVLVDCERMTFIDSCGVRVLLTAYEELKRQGRKMLVVSVAPAPHRVCERLGLTDLLHIERAGPIEAH
jgi:stage II sporulation protein AA (anti-sigma F factor antagonist)